MLKKNTYKVNVPRVLQGTRDRRTAGKLRDRILSLDNLQDRINIQRGESPRRGQRLQFVADLESFEKRSVNPPGSSSRIRGNLRRECC